MTVRNFWICAVFSMIVPMLLIEAADESQGQEERKTRRERSKKMSSQSRFGSRRPLWPDKCPVHIVFVVAELARYQTMYLYKSMVDISKEYTLRGVFAKATEQIEREHRVRMSEFTEPNPITARMESNDGTSKDLTDLRSGTDILKRLCRQQANLTFMFKTSYYLAQVDIRVKLRDGTVREETYSVDVDKNSTMTVGELADEFAGIPAINYSSQIVYRWPQAITLRTKAGPLDIYDSAVKVIAGGALFLPANLKNDEFTRVPVDVQQFNYVEKEKNPRAVCIVRAKYTEYCRIFEIARDCLRYLATKNLLGDPSAEYSYDSKFPHYLDKQGKKVVFIGALVLKWSQGHRLQMRFAKSVSTYCDSQPVLRLGVFPEMKLQQVCDSTAESVGKKLRIDQAKLYKSRPTKITTSKKIYKQFDVEIYSDLIGLPEVHIAFYSR